MDGTTFLTAVEMSWDSFGILFLTALIILSAVYLLGKGMNLWYMGKLVKEDAEDLTMVKLKKKLSLLGKGE
jgi:hypothetical protein